MLALVKNATEPYRRAIFARALDARDDRGHPRYNLILCGRAKKNWKSADLVLAALYCLIVYGGEGYIVDFDEEQAGGDLRLLKRFVKANLALKTALKILTDRVERRDGAGFMQVLPGQSVPGEHGRTFRFLGTDEVHTQRTWDLLEALQPDPTRADAQTWITSYASIYHRPGVPLFDLCQMGRAGSDPRMLFSWYCRSC